MDNVFFSKSFAFNELRFHRRHYTDNRAGCGCHYIGRMIEGRARLISEQEDISVEAGDIFYIPMGCRYQSYWYGEPMIRFDSFGFQYFPQARECAYPLQRMGKLPQTEPLFALLTGGCAADCTSVGVFYQLLGALLPGMTGGAQSPARLLVERATAYLYAHPDFSAGELAAHCRVSQSALYAAFRAETGETPVHTRQRIQIERAVTLLTTTDLSIEEISERLGFCSPAYFRKVLRRLKGQSPRDIRRGAAF